MTTYCNGIYVSAFFLFVKSIVGFIRYDAINFVMRVGDELQRSCRKELLVMIVNIPRRQ